MDLGSRLRHIRQSKDYTLEDVHNKSGISIATLSNWENNVRLPSTNTLTRWCNALGISIWDIFFEYPSSFNPSADELTLVSFFRELEPDQQKVVLVLVEMLSQARRDGSK